MRILHIHSGNLFGGVETLMLTIARERDCVPVLESRFALCFESTLARKLIEERASVEMLGTVRARNPLSIVRARRRLRHLLERDSVDVAICHMCWAHGLFASTVRRAHVPLAFWMHDAAHGRHWTERVARLFPPDITICNSQYTAQTLDLLFPRVRREVVYYPTEFNAVHLSEPERAAIRTEFQTPTDSVVILQASRIEPWKGHQMLLEALGRLRETPKWTCWVAGGAQRPHETVYLEKLKARANELGIADRMRFIGHRSDVKRILAAADIYCQPNASPEPFGLIFVEALVAGLPVVSVASGGVLEIIDHATGILTAPDDPAALATALKHLLDDPSERARLGGAGPSRARELCDPTRQLNRLSKVLSTISSARH